MNINKIIKSDEFGIYFIIGAIATFIDWSVFSALVQLFHTHYQIALIASFSTAGITHYVANKLFTFKCRSKQIGSQFSLYVLVWLLSLSLNMAIMFALIKFMMLNDVAARVATTIVFLIPNYLLHKYITFNKKIFI